MLGREVKNDAVAQLTQEPLTGGHRLQDAGPAFDAEIDGEAVGRCDEAHHGLGAMDVELIHDQMPLGGGAALGEQIREPLRKVLLGTGRAEVVDDPAGHRIEGGDQRQRAMADVFELAPFDQPEA